MDFERDLRRLMQDDFADASGQKAFYERIRKEMEEFSDCIPQELPFMEQVCWYFKLQLHHARMMEEKYGDPQEAPPRIRKIDTLLAEIEAKEKTFKDHGYEPPPN